MPPPGGVGYLKNRSLATASSASDSSFSHQATATCPAGSTAIGGGGEVVGETPSHVAPNDVALVTTQRAGLLGTGWRAVAHEVDLTPVQWKVTAYAICANINGALTTATYIGPKEDAIQSPMTQPGPPRSGTQSWVAPCPSGRRGDGAGGHRRHASTCRRRADRLTPGGRPDRHRVERRDPGHRPTRTGLPGAAAGDLRLTPLAGASVAPGL